MEGIVAASIAAVVAVLGYLVASAAARRERLAKTFAEALSAVSRYADVAYRVRRRPREDPDIRWELAQLLSDAHAAMDFYEYWMAVEAPAISESYTRLVHTARDEVGKAIKSAWEKPPFARDVDINAGLGAEFGFDQGELPGARKECIARMRKQLRRSRLWA
jgi:hypothetical protein